MRDGQGIEPVRSRQFFGTLALLAAAALLPGSAALAHGGGGNPCVKTAWKMFSSCQSEVYEEFAAREANCLNFDSAEDRADCRDEARDTRREDREGCGDQKEARIDACELLNEYRYGTEPLTDPSLEFVDPDTITTANGNLNPFFSLEAGHTYVLKGGEDGEETVVVHVTDQIREILGQPCRVVVDAVLLVEDGEYEAVEITDDTYAQATNGDVYYCSETSRNFEDGVLRDLDGSFEAGFPDDFTRAKSGILIKEDPDVDDSHRQEFFLGEAEDLIVYRDLAADVPEEEGGDDALPVAFQCDSDCLKTEEFNPNEPHDGEFKYYRFGIGFVLGVALDRDGDEVTPNGARDELQCVGDSLAVLEDPSCGIGDAEALLETLCTLSPVFCPTD